MNLGEVLLIAVGLSLDVFAVVICRGALLSRIEKKRLLLLSAVFAVWQVGALVIGSLLGRISNMMETLEELNVIWRTGSMAIFVILGIYLLTKAKKGRPIQETCRDSFPVKEMIFLACATSLDAFFAGIGFAFLQTSMLKETISIAVVTVLAVLFGIYTGYRLGYEYRAKAYIAGGILLVAAGVELFVRFQI
ncbi:MAG: manganese efflux pump [Lachnospiraceae bacterium]|nr:manganese efflux pump [Lachnospiraceae bacterium]